jgi:hypothetical protein
MNKVNNFTRIKKPIILCYKGVVLSRAYTINMYSARTIYDTSSSKTPPARVFKKICNICSAIPVQSRIKLLVESLYETLCQGRICTCFFPISVQKQIGIFACYIQHCFICRLSGCTESEDAGIEFRTVATFALTARLSNQSARSHLQWIIFY